MKNSAQFSAIFANQQGQTAAIFLAIFAFLLVFFMIPRKFTRSTAGESSGCRVGIPPAQSSTIRLPKIADMNLDRGVGENGPIMDELVDFVLIRQNVPVGESVFFLAEEDSPPNEHSFRINSPVLPNHVLYYPGRFGHVKFHRAFNSPLDNGPEKNIMLYRTEGLVVAVQKNPDGSEVIQEMGDPTRPQIVRIADFYQAKEVFDKQKGYQTEELFYCASEIEGGSTSGSGVMIPPQQVSPDNQQLQLEWFIFGKQQSTAGFVYPHCKPAVYLYPPHKMQINVKVFPSGTLSYTDPIYDLKQGWNVTAFPDGKIYDSRVSEYPKPFNYLYFESKIRDEVIQKPAKGWVIKSEQGTVSSEQWFKPLEKHFNEALPKLGLNAVQTQDFIEYWKKALPYSPYYFVGVIDRANVDQIEKLEITPKPDYINRVRIYFERLDQPKVVEAPQLEADSFQLQASSFNVVEWGGMVKTDLNHPFTCSQ